MTTPDLKKLAEVKRYDPEASYIGTGDYVGDMRLASDGEYVRYSDHAALQQEAARWEQDALQKLNDYKCAMIDLQAAQQEVETLRATLEYNEARLREWMLDHARQRREIEISQERLAHARQEALEEAAKVCERFPVNVIDPDIVAVRLMKCAADIRALQHTGEVPVVMPAEPPEAVIRAIEWQIGPGGKTAGTATGIYQAARAALEDGETKP